MMMKIVLLGTMFLLSSCATVNDAGRAYFIKGDKVQGVEAAHSVVERMDSDQELREIMYGQVKAAKILQCTLLRNQLYVAAAKGPATKEVLESVRLMEEAYQGNDSAFLTACDQIMATELGKTFVAIQQEYVAKMRR